MPYGKQTYSSAHSSVFDGIEGVNFKQVQRHCFSNASTNNQLDATMTVYYNFNQLEMFRAIVSPILRSTRLCLQLVV